MGSIDAALAALESGESENIAEIARNYDVDRTTLWRRYRGITESRAVRDAQQQLLTEQEESELVEYINELTNKGLPPTHQMVRNFAAEIAKSVPGKNWVERFLQRHIEELLSSYLEGLDLSRKKSENYEGYQQYFKQVRDLLRTLKCN